MEFSSPGSTGPEVLLDREQTAGYMLALLQIGGSLVFILH